MGRFIVSLFALLGLTLTTWGQVLYKVSGNGLQKPSYLLGTYHFASASFADSIPGFHHAMDQVGQVCGEIDMALMTSPDMLLKMQDAMNLPEGTTLASLLNKEEMDAVKGVQADRDINHRGSFDNPERLLRGGVGQWTLTS